MAQQTGKNFVLNGVGEAWAKRVVNGKVEAYKLGTLQTMKLSFSSSDEKVYGSDALPPIYILNKESNVQASFTEARFNLDYLGVTAGADVDNNGTLIFSVKPTLIASGTAFTVPSVTNVIPEDTIVVLANDNQMEDERETLKYTKSTTPSAGEFTIDASGVITLGTSVTNKFIEVSGLRTDTTSRKATMKATSVPQFVEIRHVSNPVDMGDGKKVILHTHIFRARATGKMDIDHERQKASAPQLEFEVMYDTTRTDGKILEITQEIQG
nr:MAG TPA: hypothetical protein [Caudoviricetes sp.]